MNNDQLLKKFYTSFANGDAQGMIDCYHADIVFKDPAFGTLKGDRAKSMWQMLISKRDTDTKIQFSNVVADNHHGTVQWIAEYKYGSKRRRVINKVSARFEFLDGKIILHHDKFNLWKWSQQALGLSGFLLGWSIVMRNKIQALTNSMLTQYINEHKTQ